jgi:hypothetical protein
MSKNGSFKIGPWVRILAVAVLLLAAFGAGWKSLGVSAQEPVGSEPGASSEQPKGIPTDKQASSSEVASPYVPSELDAGALRANEAAPAARTIPLVVEASPYSPSETGAGLSQVNETSPARQFPGSLAAPADQATVTAVYPTHWYTVAGTAFNPSNSSTSYVYDSLGCVHATSGGQWRAMVNLPDGAVLKYAWFIYKNDATSTSTTAWVTRYYWSGQTTDLTTINSIAYSGTAGIFATQSAEFTATVDNYNYAYVFVWNGSTNQELCQMQLGYYPPSAFGLVALPMVNKRP